MHLHGMLLFTRGCKIRSIAHAILLNKIHQAVGKWVRAKIQYKNAAMMLPAKIEKWVRIATFLTGKWTRTGLRKYIGP